jgi:mono/diheme cytochrome c family protein
MARRDAPGGPPEQMPPLATRRVDEEGVAAVRAWIEAMSPAAGYPAAAP